MVLEPLDGENEGIFLLSLSRPQARNSIGRQFLRVGLPGPQRPHLVCSRSCRQRACHRMPLLFIPKWQELRECLSTVAQERTTRW